MIDQRKMIGCLLLLEAMCLRLASLMGLILLIIGQGLKTLFAGRRGRRLLSHREIYARNILKYWQEDGGNRINRGVYIGRVGRHYSSRHLRVGQD